jgi:hypothetical protein
METPRSRHEARQLLRTHPTAFAAAAGQPRSTRTVTGIAPLPVPDPRGARHQQPAARALVGHEAGRRSRGGGRQGGGGGGGMRTDRWPPPEATTSARSSAALSSTSAQISSASVSGRCPPTARWPKPPCCARGRRTHAAQPTATMPSIEARWGPTTDGR